MAGECSVVSQRLPSTWRTEVLAKLVTAIRNGTTATQNQNGVGPPVTRIETISDGFVDYSKVRHLDAPPQDLDLHRLHTGDILLSHINSVKHIGKVARYGGEYPLIHGMNLLRIIFDEQRLDPFFGYYTLSSTRAKRYFERRAKKAINQASLNRKDIGAFPVFQPPLPEQRKIAAILSSVDDAIEKTRAVIDQGQVVKRGLMQELLTRGLPGRHTQFKLTEIGEIPKEWKLMPLGDVGFWSSGGTPSKQQPEYWNGSIPWISPKDMKRTRINDAIDHVSKAAIGNGARVTPKGSILVVVRGMILAHTFPVALTLTDVTFNQDMKALVPNEHFDPEFLLYWLESQQKRILSLVDASSHGTKRLPTSKLFAEPVPCPQRDEQKNIAQCLRSHDIYYRSAIAAREEVTTIKTALMSTLLTGELRVTPVPEAA